jgi:hypothetical protein
VRKISFRHALGNRDVSIATPLGDGEPPGAREPALRLTDPAAGISEQPAPLRFSLGRVAIVAAVLGAVINLLTPVDPHLNLDSRAFEAIARSLLAGQGFVYREPLLHGLPFYAFRSTGYAAFLALGLWLGGVTAAVALQGALQGVSAALVGDLAGRWAGTRAAWLAFAIRFVWPAGWFHAGQLMSEGFFEFTTLLAVWLAVRTAERRGLRWAVAAGVMTGVAVLTRPVGLGCALAITAWLCVRFPRGAAALALAALLTWLPWPLRNAQRLHAWVPFLTSGGVASWNTHSGNPPSVAWSYMAQHTDLGEVGLDRHFREAAFEIIRSDPMAFVRRLGRGCIEYVGPIFYRGREVWLHRFALLALIPALFWADTRRRLVLPGLVWAGEGLLMLPIALHSRYRFPTEWCVIVAAAVGLDAAAGRWGTRRAGALALGALLLCIAFTLAVARG